MWGDASERFAVVACGPSGWTCPWPEAAPCDAIAIAIGAALNKTRSSSSMQSSLCEGHITVLPDGIAATRAIVDRAPATTRRHQLPVGCNFFVRVMIILGSLASHMLKPKPAESVKTGKKARSPWTPGYWGLGVAERSYRSGRSDRTPYPAAILSFLTIRLGW